MEGINRKELFLNQQKHFQIYLENEDSFYDVILYIFKKKNFLFQFNKENNYKENNIDELEKYQFCNKDNINRCISYIDHQLEILGLNKINDEFRINSIINEENNQLFLKIINILYSLLEKVQVFFFFN